jgi:hypothetical protein
MSVLTTFHQATRGRICGLALTVATLFGACSAQSQTVYANFANRNGATKPVPAGLFGVGGTGSTVRNQAPVNLITTAGMNQTRFWISLAQVYATSTPNFSSIDSALKIMQASGLHPLAVIYATPSSLGSRTCSPPSSTWKWGQMAAAVVAHVDRNFRGVLQDYEIWNEPELATSFCAANATAELNSYVSMFAAASSAMHAQASRDGDTIRVGGPVISQLSQAPKWIPALLNNSSTAPYVDFVSFHLYITGLTDIQHGMNWSQLYARTQSSTQGVAHYYKWVEPLVRAGHQRNPWSTPIYITEYNDNWAYAVECCRNNPTYAPLWNSLAVADLLNVVYTGSTAVPSKLNYFNSAGKDFCIIGQWNNAMDCNTSAQYPYPQFFAYKLFASPQYLNLQAGGHMAASVSPASTTWGLTATAFYTSKGDDVVVINPTSTSYGAVTVTLSNPGLTAGVATVYLLNRANSQITTESVTLTRVSGGYTARVAVPAYSTVAVALL